MSDALPKNIDDLMKLIDYRQETPETIRIRAATELGMRVSKGDEPLAIPRAIVILVEQVRLDTNIRVVSHCIGVLGRVKAASGAMVLVDVALGGDVAIYEGAEGSLFLLSDKSVRVRCVAIQALGRLSDERAVIPLMSLLNDRNVHSRIRMAAAESLGKAGDPNAVRALVAILEDEREKSVYLKESSAKALGMLGDIRAIDSLLNVLETKRGIRDKFDFLKEQAIEAIGRITGGEHSEESRVKDNLLHSLQDQAASIRLAAIEALIELGEPDCIDALIGVLSDTNDDVAIAAVSAVFQLGGEAAVRELRVMEKLPQFLRDEIESYIP